MEIRRATDGDYEAVLWLLRDALDKEEGPRYRDFFRWKHVENPFGVSPAWVAEEGGELLGFRTFMRWMFTSNEADISAVRAVDTATARHARGRGVFTALTLRALEELKEEGVQLVFNTPNALSRPGYLKMGWIEVGRLPVAMRPHGPGALGRIARARHSAELWSQPCTVGRSVDSACDSLHRLRRPAAGMATKWPPGFLQWRYGFHPLHYRVIDEDDAAIVFRLRKRGPATELAVCEIVGHSRVARKLVRHAVRATEADYAIATGSPRGFTSLPGQGPILTTRPLAYNEPAKTWALSLGDVELF